MSLKCLLSLDNVSFGKRIGICRSPSKELLLSGLFKTLWIYALRSSGSLSELEVVEVSRLRLSSWRAITLITEY